MSTEDTKVPEQLASKIGNEQKEALEEWYRWVDIQAGEWVAKLRPQLALEIGSVPAHVQALMHEVFTKAMRAAGRQIVTMKLIDTMRRSHE